MASATRKTDDSKPAKGKAGDDKSVGVKELAAHLETDARALRAFLRRTERGTGRGTRYSWPSLSDPAVKKIAADWKKAQSPVAAPAGPDKGEES